MSLVTVTTLVGIVLVLALFKACLALRRGFASLGSCPRGGLFWFHPMLLATLVLAPIFPPRGWLGHYNGRFHLYAKKGTTILSGLWVWPAKPMFWLADVDAIKAVTSDRHTFTKDLSAYVLVDIYGKNVVSTEGNEWRRHAAVAGPAFSDSINALAWKETLRLVLEWFSDELDLEIGSGQLDTDSAPTAAVTVNVLTKMTQLTLHVIAAAGFGMRAPWTTFNDMHSHKHSTDEILPFHVALDLTLVYLPVRILVPSFLYSLPFRIPWVSDQLTLSTHAFASMKTHMAGIVASVRSESKVQSGGLDHNQSAVEEERRAADANSDLLRRLVRANDINDEVGDNHKRALTDNELFSNIFMFLLAGHETSAHTLCFAILLLALYPDVQAKLREEAYRIWLSDDDVKASNYKKDFDKFEYTLAFFRETLRCFPTEPRLIKLASKDTTLTGRRFRLAPGTAIRKPDASFDGAGTNVQFQYDKSKEERFSIVIPEGSVIMLDVWAAQMNPMVWGADAHEFRPERFIDTEDYKWPRDGFIAFSSGARGCIGQRFALTEAVCVLANLVRRYEILPAIDARRFATHEEFKQAMLGYFPNLTITPNTKYVKLRRFGDSN